MRECGLAQGWFSDAFVADGGIEGCGGGNDEPEVRGPWDVGVGAHAKAGGKGGGGDNEINEGTAFLGKSGVARKG